METKDAEHELSKKKKMLNMNKDLILNFKDALSLLTVLFIGPKKWRVCYQLLALFILML